MDTAINLLMVEDSQDDADLLLRELRRVGFVPMWARVDTELDFLTELKKLPDLIFSDYSMPQFSAKRMATLLQDSGLDIPFILISGTLGEEIVVEAMQFGATDYLLKDRIARLGMSVRRALEEKRLRDERRQIKEERQASESRYRTLFECAPDGIMITAPSGGCLDANGSMCRMLGYIREELIRLSLAQVVVEDETEPTATAASTTMAEGDCHRELRFRRKSGTFFCADVVATKMPDGNMLTMVSDITERKRAIERTFAALRELNDVKAALDEHAIVAITDSKGKITYVNDKFCAISKFRREELVGQDHRIINSGFHSKEFIQNLWESISDGRVWKGEIKNKAKDGSFYWVDTTIVPYRDKEGKPVQYIAIRADITERKHFENALQTTNRELSRALSQVKQLNALLPICSYCKKIRDDSNYWQSVESYITDHTDAHFSHGICPDCVATHFPADLQQLMAKAERSNGE